MAIIYLSIVTWSNPEKSRESRKIATMGIEQLKVVMYPSKMEDVTSKEGHLESCSTVDGILSIIGSPSKIITHLFPHPLVI